MSYTQAQIQQQNTRFKQARDSGEITQAQYEQAMATQNVNMAKAITAKTQPQPQVISQSTSPLPSDPSTTVVKQSGGATWVRSDYTVAKTEETAAGTKYTLLPKQTTPPPQNKPANLNSALQQGIFGKNPDIFRSTGIEGLTPLINTKEKAEIASALTVVVAAPVFGPAVGVSASSVLVGEGLGVGIKQVFKSVAGEGWLTPKEALFGAAEGGAFSVAGGAILGGATKLAPSLLGPAAKPFVRVSTRIALNTGLGAGASGILSGGNPEAIAQGAAFGFAFGVAGEGIGAAGSKIKSWKVSRAAANRIQEDVFGVKFNEVTGVKELRTQYNVGKETKVMQLTEPSIKDVTLRGKEARFYRENNLSTLRNPTVELAGVEKVYQSNMITGGKQVEPIPFLRQVESIRNAEPLMAALKGDTSYKLASVKTGNINKFLKTPSNMPAIRKSQITIETAKFQPTAVLASKTILTKTPAILPETKINFRDFTGVKFKGLVDPKIYADPAKSVPLNIAQDIYLKLGGGVKQTTYFPDTKISTLTGSMKPLGGSIGSKPSNVPSSALNPSVVLKQTTTIKPQTVTLPRAIIGEVKASTQVKTIGGFPTMFTKSSFAQEEEITFLSYPNSKLATPTMIKTPLMQPTQFLNRALVPTQTQSQRISNLFMPTLRTVPIQSPIIKPLQVPAFIQIQTPKQTQPQTIKFTQPQAQRQQQKQTVSFAQPQMMPTRTFNTPLIPAFGLGGGSGHLGPKRKKRGQWFEKKHKIKTYSQMLQTFGLGKAGKPMRKMDKMLTPRLERLDKSVLQLGKAFNQKTRNNKRRKK